MKFVVAFLFFSVFSVLSADPIRPLTKDLPKTNLPDAEIADPFTQLDQTISLTQKSLDEQKELRKLVEEYVNLHRAYKQNLEDRELSYQMVKQAHKVLAKIKEMHLSYAFQQQFLSDLAFFSGIIERWEGLDSLSTTE